MVAGEPTFRVRALTIACTDADRSEHFYREVLGATPLPTDNGLGWWFRLGSLDINLLPNAAEPSPAEFPVHAMPILWPALSATSLMSGGQVEQAFGRCLDFSFGRPAA
jgi:hypothetical protein